MIVQCDIKDYRRRQCWEYLKRTLRRRVTLDQTKVGYRSQLKQRQEKSAARVPSLYIFFRTSQKSRNSMADLSQRSTSAWMRLAYGGSFIEERRPTFLLRQKVQNLICFTQSSILSYFSLIEYQLLVKSVQKSKKLMKQTSSMVQRDTAQAQTAKLPSATSNAILMAKLMRFLQIERLSRYSRCLTNFSFCSLVSSLSLRIEDSDDFQLDVLLICGSRFKFDWKVSKQEELAAQRSTSLTVTFRKASFCSSCRNRNILRQNALTVCPTACVEQRQFKSLSKASCSPTNLTQCPCRSALTVKSMIPLTNTAVAHLMGKLQSRQRSELSNFNSTA